MKLLVTHDFPHFDDIAGFWLYRRYVPGFAKARDGYVTLKGGGEAVTWKGKPADSDNDVVHIGVGRGKYDEHKGDIGKCATLLVFEDLKRRKLIPRNELEAMTKLVDFVNLQDTGRLTYMPFRQYYIPTVLRTILPSEKRTEIGYTLFDGIFQLLQEEVVMDRDWKKRVEFMTPWGKGVAVTSAMNAPEGRAYGEGFQVVIQVDPKRKWRMLRAPAESKVDFSRMYEIVRALEPKAGWFLHHSKHMLLCGSRSGPNVVMSKLSLQKLIDMCAHDSSRTDQGKNRHR